MTPQNGVAASIVVGVKLAIVAVVLVNPKGRLEYEVSVEVMTMFDEVKSGLEGTLPLHLEGRG